MISLETVLKENDILLVDGSAKNGEDSNSYNDPKIGSKYLSSKGHFALICEETLAGLVNELAVFSSIVGSKNSRTIPEVAEEVYIYELGITSGYQFLMKSDNAPNLRKIVKDISEGSDDSLKQRLGSLAKAGYARDRNKKLYLDLVLRVNKCVSLLRSRGIRIIDPAYDELVEIIKILDRTVGLKKSTRKLMKEPNYSTTDSPDTDERLVATAYWISMFSNKSIGILTKDSDFFKLLTSTPLMLGAKEFYPYNKMFRIPLHKNPVKHYYKANEDSCETSSTLSIDYLKNFVLYGIDLKKTEEIRERVAQFWIHFADYHSEVGIKFEG